MSAAPQVRLSEPRRWMAVLASVVAVALVTEALWQGIIGLRPNLTESDALADYFERFATDMLAIVLIDTVLLTALIAFVALFRQIVAGSDPGIRWIADVWTGANIAVVAITLAGDGMAGGAALNARTGADPVVIRALTEGHMLMFGAVAAVPTAAALIAGAALIVRTRILPRWTALFALVGALLNLVLIPMTFWDVDDASIFSPGGWVSVGLAILPYLAWVSTVGFLLAWRPPRDRMQPAADRVES